MVKGTTRYSYTHLFTAFTISGLMYAGSMAILPSPRNLSLQESTLGVFLLFLYQALAITLEDVVQWVYRKIRVERPMGPWAAYVGYVWVVFSFWHLLPLAGDVMLRLRMGQDAPLLCSVFMPLVEKVSHEC